MIRRGKTTIFMDAKESTTVLDLKKMLQGITKKAPEDLRLYKEEQVHIENVVCTQYGRVVSPGWYLANHFGVMIDWVSAQHKSNPYTKMMSDTIQPYQV